MYHYAALAWEARPTLKQLILLRQYLALPMYVQWHVGSPHLTKVELPEKFTLRGLLFTPVQGSLLFPKI